jgi:hypothetical protein
VRKTAYLFSIDPILASFATFGNNDRGFGINHSEGISMLPVVISNIAGSFLHEWIA